MDGPRDRLPGSDRVGRVRDRVRATVDTLDTGRLKRVGVVTYFSVYAAIALGGWRELVGYLRLLPVVNGDGLGPLHVLLDLPRSLAWGSVSLAVAFSAVGIAAAVSLRGGGWRTPSPGGAVGRVAAAVRRPPRAVARRTSGMARRLGGAVRAASPLTTAGEPADEGRTDGGRGGGPGTDGRDENDGVDDGDGVDDDGDGGESCRGDGGRTDIDLVSSVPPAWTTDGPVAPHSRTAAHGLSAEAAGPMTTDDAEILDGPEETTDPDTGNGPPVEDGDDGGPDPDAPWPAEVTSEGDTESDGRPDADAPWPAATGEGPPETDDGSPDEDAPWPGDWTPADEL